jgi:prephenate dehydrogenase
MSDYTVAIVGTGVIGTSLGLALKQRGDEFRVLAHDKELGQAKEAVKMGAFDKAEWNLINASEPADLILLALPLSAIRPTLEAIAPYLKQDVVISDTCNNKEAVLVWANELLPDHAHFVGGNPIVQPGGTGYKHARADLFQNRLYCLTPAPAAHEGAVQLMVGLVALLGAEPFFLDPTEHDGLITSVEYLPHLLGVALLRTLSEQTSWREIRKLAGGLFERVSSGAEGDPDALSESFLNNRETLIYWVDAYLHQLRALRQLLASKDLAEAEEREQLAQIVDKAVVDRRNWLNDYQKGEFLDPELSGPNVETPGLLNQMVGFGGLRKRFGASPKDKKTD